jgi:hypothetical protein
MATLLINDIPDKELADLSALARQDNVPLEQEAILAIRHYADSRKRTESLIPRGQLLAEAERLHGDMASRGICIAEKDISAAIQEARR